MPGMITPNESAFYEQAATAFVGETGAVVDLGCWLGGTSVALARGTGSCGKVLAYDLFRWERWMPAGVAYCLYQPGDCFLPEARRLIRDHGGNVELIQADLTSYKWSGGQIKILLVDAMKSEALARKIAQRFYPSLKVGGLVIHQDFKHFYTSWIHLLHCGLREFFHLYRIVPNSTTVAFEVTKPIPADVVARATDFGSLSSEEIDECFRHSLALAEDDPNVAAAHVMHYIHLGRRDRAQATLDGYRGLGISERGDFALVASKLKSGK